MTLPSGVAGNKDAVDSLLITKTVIRSKCTKYGTKLNNMLVGRAMCCPALQGPFSIQHWPLFCKIRLCMQRSESCFVYVVFPTKTLPLDITLPLTPTLLTDSFNHLIRPCSVYITPLCSPHLCTTLSTLQTSILFFVASTKSPGIFFYILTCPNMLFPLQKFLPGIRFSASHTGSVRSVPQPGRRSAELVSCAMSGKISGQRGRRQWDGIVFRYRITWHRHVAWSGR